MGLTSSVPQIPSDKSIVVVGAGYGGALVGMAMLKSQANFTIISPNDMFHHNVGAVRAVVESDFSEKIMIPLEKSFGKHHKQGKVVQVKPEENKVVLDSGEEMAYDLLVIATGSKHTSPMKLSYTNMEEAREIYKVEAEKVKVAKRVVIVGGGATGVETAAEIAHKYPEKEVTIVTNTSYLVNQKLSEKSQKAILDALQTMKINIIFGETITNLDVLAEDGPYSLSTDKSRTIEADYVLKAIGLTPNTEAYENGLSSSMEEGGRLKVNKYLQVEGWNNIYAMGDCNNVEEGKTAYQAIEQSKVLSHTIRAVLTGGQPSEYTAGSGPFGIAVSLGPNNAVAELKNGFSIPSFLMIRFKARDLMSGKQWNDLGQKVPS